MAIIVEDGTEIANANSYISVADCSTYLDLRGKSDWGLSDTGLTEASLIIAADYLEQRYKLKWKGIKTTSTQQLSFPRSGLTDEDGYSITSTTIPQQLKDAQCLLALRAIDTDAGENADLTVDVTQDNLIKRKKEKLDVIEEEVEYFGKVTNTFYQEVDDLLLSLLDSIQLKAVRG